MSGGSVIAASGLRKDYGSGRGLFGLDLAVGAAPIAVAVVALDRRDLRA